MRRLNYAVCFGLTGLFLYLVTHTAYFWIKYSNTPVVSDGLLLLWMAALLFVSFKILKIPVSVSYSFVVSSLFLGTILTILSFLFDSIFYQSYDQETLSQTLQLALISLTLATSQFLWVLAVMVGAVIVFRNNNSVKVDAGHTFSRRGVVRKGIILSTLSACLIVVVFIFFLFAVSERHEFYGTSDLECDWSKDMSPEQSRKCHEKHCLSGNPSCLKVSSSTDEFEFPLLSYDPKIVSIITDGTVKYYDLGLFSKEDTTDIELIGSKKIGVLLRGGNLEVPTLFTIAGFKNDRYVIEKNWSEDRYDYYFNFEPYGNVRPGHFMIDRSPDLVGLPGAISYKKKGFFVDPQNNYYREYFSNYKKLGEFGSFTIYNLPITGYENRYNSVSASSSAWVAQRLKADEYIDGEYAKIVLVDHKNNLAYDYEAMFGGKLLSVASTPGQYTVFGSEISSDVDLYEKYSHVMPGGCGYARATQLAKNISERELSQIGLLNGVPVYVLRPKTHPLYRIVFEHRKSVSFPEDLKNVTYEEYVAGEPLLFMKDQWGRLIVLMEHQYSLIGGCGKPVLYFYPKFPTIVDVEFATPMKLTTDIPKYSNGWRVLAHPNSLLVDLQPEKTDCSAIDYQKFGSGYAVSACRKAVYPYIYWSGNSLSREYPITTGGWVVFEDYLESFLENKLNFVGLTEREKSDMISYWVPKMKLEGTPYYLISFLQTEELNDFIPMSIYPKPDNYHRIFLNYLPLNSRPDIEPQPQILHKWNREGFTVVEWGGLEIRPN